MKHVVKKLLLSAALCAAMLGTSAVAFADASMDFTVTGLSYDEDEILVATGIIENTGDKHIETVDRVDMTLSMSNDAGEEVSTEAYCENIQVHLAPGESKEITIKFPSGTKLDKIDNPTCWKSKENDWQFTYYDAE
ncbi:hypothetical protein [Paenibacillus thalictri]|uniref:Uncharacterized protein n=1 Tax=Paenibacillus thalictri TaxID=2527873 RepID=A0A4Q9E101_9BACL|nr:hypothetical protein [Paenibacillus thalictri]TBL81833.1 hypothetical protein EYB31_02260 [Paenibacillus thalictri]